jgi:hypothetical protein
LFVIRYSLWHAFATRFVGSWSTTENSAKIIHPRRSPSSRANLPVFLDERDVIQATDAMNPEDMKYYDQIYERIA